MSPPASTNSLLVYTDGNRLFNAKPAMRFWSPIYFFTDSWATVIFCGRLFCPRQSEYSGILSSLLIASRDLPCTAISPTRLINRL